MPIRFRCVYCEKLLGIARRKAGAIVNCPHCGEQLIVPTPDTEDATAAPTEEPNPAEDESVAAGPQLFERSDFEALLQPEPTFRTGEDESAPKPRSRGESVSREQAAAPTRSLPEPVVEPLSLDDRPREGVFLSRTKVTWLSVAGVVLLALAFAGGLLVGRFMRPG